MRSIFFIFLFLAVSICCAQNNDIPLGAWRLHLNYSTIKSVAVAHGKIYGAANLGVMYVDELEHSTGSITKLNGLGGIEVNCLANDVLNKILIIGYQDGAIDFVESDKIRNLSTLKTTTSITGSRSINHITVTGTTAYASTDFGVVVLDIAKKEIRETWRDLGVAGQTIQVFQSTILNDSIFLATEKGVWCGSLKTNLLDFNSWKKYNTGVFSSGVKTITAFNNEIYAAIDGVGIYKKQGLTWIKLPFVQNATYAKLIGSDTKLFVCTETQLWKIEDQGQLSLVNSEYINGPMDVLERNGNLYVGDQSNGIVFLGSNNEAVSYIMSGPRLNTGWDIRNEQGAIQAISGGYTESLLPLKNEGTFSTFAQDWSTSKLSINDITDFDISDPTRSYYSSFTDGLLVKDAQQEIRYDITNSPLGNNAIPAIVKTSDGLWIANYNATKPLHLLKSDGSWESFSFTFSSSRFPVDLLADNNGNIWMTISPKDGGGLVVFNKQSNKSVYLSDLGGQGGMPSKKVSSIALDRDGRVWVGTEQGVCYFSNTASIFNGNINATKPIYDSRYLLRDENVRALTIDGGNRKWMGSENGVWLFDPLGETLIYNYNISNSPMLSNRIQTIGINSVSGEVFFGTDKGIVSFRSDATNGQSNFDQVKIFPNPVTAQFNGLVSIEGLVTDSMVKITDIAGKLIWQTMANGGTASWNVHDINGKHVGTGIYLIFSTVADGSDKNVGKIAIIE